MTVVLDSQPAKYLNCLNDPIKGRIIKGLQKLGNEPPEGDIKKLQGRLDYRLRIGGYRVIFRIENETIIVSKIAPRGQAYKE
ncbi:MAG: type II toxin-antitoxin system RelE/ParE family toxin [Termitinemataceae bacterium]|nr:MAG: type II toxin-antitoxin system RelE/ParE family toxin [Termitinemataceae bacterium]